MATQTADDFQQRIEAAIRARDWASAAAAAAACRATWPQSLVGWLLGSIVALCDGRNDQALAIIDERLATHDAEIESLLQRAECLYVLGRREEALRAADAVVAHGRSNAAALDAVGSFLAHAQAHARAREVYDAAIGLAPRDPRLRGKRAVLNRYLGEFTAAAADFNAVLELSPGDADALKGLAELRRQTAEHNSVAQLEAALLAGPTSSDATATLHFALAKNYEDLAAYASSWRHLAMGNALERASFDYDPALERAVTERIVASFPAVEPVAVDSTRERPIFVVGLPRSGTTLVERILGSHSQVHAAGELAALSEAISAVIARTTDVAAMDWLEFAARLGGIDGAELAPEYLARAQARRGERPRFVDKQPTNFNYCALILRAFPNAAIVHVTRHPLAVCHALYKTRFRGPFPFSYDLDELADYYIGYRRLMAHWHRVLPGRIVDLAYEDVVTQQEASTRGLLAQLGLDFEPACLAPHENPQSVTTASSVQVRQPVYRDSLEQWRHYADGLAPLRRKLVAAGIAVD